MYKEIFGIELTIQETIRLLGTTVNPKILNDINKCLEQIEPEQKIIERNINNKNINNIFNNLHKKFYVKKISTLQLPFIKDIINIISKYIVTEEFQGIETLSIYLRRVNNQNKYYLYLVLPQAYKYTSDDTRKKYLEIANLLFNEYLIKNKVFLHSKDIVRDITTYI